MDGANKTILIVEDDAGIRQMMQDVLEIEGYEVCTAVNGRDGIERLRTLKAEPGAIILDLMMPGSNGWSFLDDQRANARWSRIPVIVCSAYQESAATVAPHAILKKPVRLDELLDVVHASCS